MEDWKSLLRSLHHSIIPSFQSSLIPALALIAACALPCYTVNARLARYMGLAYVAMAMLGVEIFRHSLPAGLLVVWAAFIAWWHPSTPILPVLALIILAIAFLYFASAKIETRWIYDAICIVALACVAAQIAQGIGNFRQLPLGVFLPPPWQTLTGLMANVDETSTLLAICLPAFFRKGWRWLALAPIAGLAMCECMMGICAAGAAGLVWLWLRGRSYSIAEKAMIGAAIASSIFYMYLTGYIAWTPHAHNRLPIWRDTSIAVSVKPFGWGLGQFPMVMPLLNSPKVLPPEDRLALYDQVEDRGAFETLGMRLSGGNPKTYFAAKQWPGRAAFEAHNEYLEAAFALGIPGGLLLLWAIGAALRKGFRKEDLIPFYGLLISAVSAIAFFSWQIMPIAAITAVWAGLIYREEKCHSIG